MNMNRIIPNKPTWRDREVEKEKQRKVDEAKRAEEERMKSVRKTESNFPNLGGNKVAVKPVTNSGLFAKMAKDWKEKEDTEAALDRQRKEDEERERMRSTFYTFRASRFDRTEQDYEEDEEMPRPINNNDGWTQVDTKKTRPIRERRESDDLEDREVDVQNEELGEDYRRDYY